MGTPSLPAEDGLTSNRADVRSRQRRVVRDGHNWGIHKNLSEINVKLVYAAIFAVVWVAFGTGMFAYLEEKDMKKYQKGSHDFDAMVATIRGLAANNTLPAVEQRQLIHAANFMQKNKPATVHWGPSGGFFFSVLSLTTIGYGRFLCPQTVGGRLFVIPYTLVGIPIIAILYTVWAKRWLAAIKQMIYKFQGEAAAKWQSTTIALGIFLTMLLGVGPAIFMSFEKKWYYYEAVYFIWCSVSTIGYGDFVPETTGGEWTGIALVPLGLGICALLLASITQWFEDLILYMDYNADSYEDARASLLRSEIVSGTDEEDSDYGAVGESPMVKPRTDGRAPSPPSERPQTAQDQV